MTRVFISYASSDYSKVMDVVGDLEKGGLQCWVAPRDISPGAEYGAEIIEGIKTCESIVVFLSSKSIASKHVKSEVERAVHLEKRLYPVRLENVALDDALSFFLSIFQWVDLFDTKSEKRIEELIVSIRERRQPRRSIVSRSIKDRVRSVLFVTVVSVSITMLVIMLYNIWNARLLKVALSQIQGAAGELSLADVDVNVTRSKWDGSFQLDFNTPSALFYQSSQFKEDSYYRLRIDDEKPTALPTNFRVDIELDSRFFILELGEDGSIVQSVDLSSKVRRQATSSTLSNIDSLFGRNGGFSYADRQQYYCDNSSCAFNADLLNIICSPSVISAYVVQGNKNVSENIASSVCENGLRHSETLCVRLSFQPGLSASDSGVSLLVSGFDEVSESYKLVPFASRELFCEN